MLMCFGNKYPHITNLIGANSAKLLDDNKMQFSGAPHHERENHFKYCELYEWCLRYMAEPPADELRSIDWALGKIQAQIGVSKLCSCFRRKVPRINNPLDADLQNPPQIHSQKKANEGQFREFIAELCVAATLAVHGKVLDLEWHTGKGNKDADVQAQLGDSIVNFEVTLHTDNWFNSVSWEDTQLSDGEGNPIPKAYGRVGMLGTRETITKSEKEVMEEKGFILPISKTPDTKSHPEHDKLRSIIMEKAAKFSDGGIHIVVLCSYGPTSGYHAVQDALFGASLLRFNRKPIDLLGECWVPGGPFMEKKIPQIWAVLYFPIDGCLPRLMNNNVASPHQGNFPCLFLHPSSAHGFDEPLMKKMAKIFGAKVFPLIPKEC